MGFKRDIDKIVQYLKPPKTSGTGGSNNNNNVIKPVVRQTLLFSATFSEEGKN